MQTFPSDWVIVHEAFFPWNLISCSKNNLKINTQNVELIKLTNTRENGDIVDLQKTCRGKFHHLGFKQHPFGGMSMWEWDRFREELIWISGRKRGDNSGCGGNGLTKEERRLLLWGMVGYCQSWIICKIILKLNTHRITYTSLWNSIHHLNWSLIEYSSC